MPAFGVTPKFIVLTRYFKAFDKAGMGVAESDTATIGTIVARLSQSALLPQCSITARRGAARHGPPSRTIADAFHS